ncbi:unnamed protein product [Didymodactylos carnosus]|uniref:50S ribosomal protein L5 n=1 Tax=Didymodactylos carnosus TaxID=1234261 RepID=A0A8S2GKU6_9BILA|nr:unnamed protein product [Didymodactylos carnosus]CAF3532461.1 unnamed protein product [Didymodactylos carnosus]
MVINMGVGDAAQDVKKLERGIEEITLITGQKPVVTKSKISIAAFKLRDDKLLTVALPRVRDFRGTPVRSFDGFGNYTLGIKEQIIFTEIDYDKVQKIRGFDVTFVTSAKTDDEAYDLLALLGMPFVRTGHRKGDPGREEANQPASTEETTSTAQEGKPH